MLVEKAGHVATCANHLALKSRVSGRLVKEEDQVPFLVYPLHLEVGGRLRRIEEEAVREVVDRVDCLRGTVFADDKIVLSEAEHLIAAGIGHDGIDLHQVDVDLLAEWLWWFLLRLLREER